MFVGKENRKLHCGFFINISQADQYKTYSTDPRKRRLDRILTFKLWNQQLAFEQDWKG